ncbi:hypothetical protein Jiend_07220 [Micromonospora endophytica]|uniref:hypothetical protein n=1 Tax=Micromonospora endophytica TaxID=515350 RepID=UPI001C324350|nr:hypothetical protein [Micromonospora endophytica]BCJ57300.1 hypothetical protein Jiend_07220 [Micromonospora endophytica]
MYALGRLGLRLLDPTPTASTREAADRTGSTREAADRTASTREMADPTASTCEMADPTASTREAADRTGRTPGVDDLAAVVEMLRRACATDPADRHPDAAAFLAALRQASAPTREASTPTREASTPTQQASAPTREASTPTREASTPTQQASAPTREASAPTREAGTPTREASTPTREASTPTREAGTPTRQAGAPTRQASTPTRVAGTLTREGGASSRQVGLLAAQAVPLARAVASAEQVGAAAPAEGRARHIRSRWWSGVGAVVMLLLAAAAVAGDSATVAGTATNGPLHVVLPAGWRSAGTGWAGRYDTAGRLEPAMVISPEPRRWATDPTVPGAFVGLSATAARRTGPDGFVAEQPHADCAPAPVRRARRGDFDWVIARFDCAQDRPILVEAAARTSAGLLYAQVVPPPEVGDEFVDTMLDGIRVR